MAEDIRNKFVSWTLNVVKEIKEIPAKPLYGVGVNLALVQPPAASSSASAASAPATPSRRYNRVGVDSVAPSGPAAAAGLRAGDVIVRVDGKDFDDGTTAYLPDDVAAAIRGPEGSTVNVTVERTVEESNDAKRRIEFVIKREPIGRQKQQPRVVTNSNNSPSGSPMRKKMVVDSSKGGEKQGTRQQRLRRGTSGGSSGSGGSSKRGAKKKGDDKAKGSDEVSNKNEAAAAAAAAAAVTPESKKKKKDAPSSSTNVLDSVESLALDEEHKSSSEEDKEDLTSSAEDVVPSMCCVVSSGPLCGAFPLSSRTVSEISEEKTTDYDYDDNDDDPHENAELVSNYNGGDEDGGSVGSSQWELISERSGSAILISFNGSMAGSSFRSASPSMLKNKFVLTEYPIRTVGGGGGEEDAAEEEGETYLEHVVLPTDTLQGLCLAYKLSATRLRMENNFSGNSLQMAPKKLRIPIMAAAAAATTSNNNSSNSNSNSSGGGKKKTTTTTMIRTQDKTSKEFKLYAFVAEIPTMELVEAKAYLDLSNWDLDEALRSAREDEGWSCSGGGGGPAVMDSYSPMVSSSLSSPSPVLTAVARPKALTARDIYAAPPSFEGDGVELKDIRQS